MALLFILRGKMRCGLKDGVTSAAGVGGDSSGNRADECDDVCWRRANSDGGGFGKGGYTMMPVNIK